MQNLINDLSNLTSTDKRVFAKLIQNANFCICDYLETMALDNQQECEIDIGIGLLKLKVIDNTIKYSFIPSELLESEIISTLENQQNLLIANIDNLLISKLNKLYDNLL